MAELIDFLRENKLKTEALYRGATQAYEDEMLRLVKNKLSKLCVSNEGDKFICNWKEGAKAYTFSKVRYSSYNDDFTITAHLILSKSGKPSKAFTYIDYKLDDEFIWKYRDLPKPFTPIIKVTINDAMSPNVIEFCLETKSKEESAKLTHKIAQEIEAKLVKLGGKLNWHRLPYHWQYNDARVLFKVSTTPDMPKSFWNKFKK